MEVVRPAEISRWRAAALSSDRECVVCSLEDPCANACRNEADEPCIAPVLNEAVVDWELFVFFPASICNTSL